MKRANRRIMSVAALAAAVTASGCQTTGDVQDSIAGAGIGAALGCGIGALAGGGSEGCAKGAAIGAVVGLAAVAIHHYEARQVRSSEQDRRVYGLSKPVSSPQVKINKGTNSPRTARVGQSIDIDTVYSVRLPPGDSNVKVKESWELKQNGKTVASLPAQTNRRSDGGWEANAEISIPDGTAPGTYVIVHKVQAGSSYDTDTSKFVVKA